MPNIENYNEPHWVNITSSDGRSYYGCQCSECNGKALCREDDYGDYYVTVLSKYCPHCGKFMSGPEETRFR